VGGSALFSFFLFEGIRLHRPPLPISCLNIIINYDLQVVLLHTITYQLPVSGGAVIRIVYSNLTFYLGTGEGTGAETAGCLWEVAERSDGLPARLLYLLCLNVGVRSRQKRWGMEGCNIAKFKHPTGSFPFSGIFFKGLRSGA
jgi:hypothetical protein